MFAPYRNHSAQTDALSKFSSSISTHKTLVKKIFKAAKRTKPVKNHQYIKGIISAKQ